MKKNIKIIITIFQIIIFCLIIIVFSSIISYRCTGVYNPISSLIGYIDIVFLDKDYKEVQTNPYSTKIVFANSDYTLEDYMLKNPQNPTYDHTSKIQGQTLYIFDFKVYQEIIEQTEMKNFLIWRWR